MWLERSICPLSCGLPVPSNVGLFHLGKDKQCLAWHCHDDDVVKFLKFSVRKNSGEICAIAEDLSVVALSAYTDLADFTEIIF